jgi:hypothetical protein
MINHKTWWLVHFIRYRKLSLLPEERAAFAKSVGSMRNRTLDCCWSYLESDGVDSKGIHMFVIPYGPLTSTRITWIISILSCRYKCLVQKCSHFNLHENWCASRARAHFPRIYFIVRSKSTGKINSFSLKWKVKLFNSSDYLLNKLSLAQIIRSCWLRVWLTNNNNSSNTH